MSKCFNRKRSLHAQGDGGSARGRWGGALRAIVPCVDRMGQAREGCIRSVPALQTRSFVEDGKRLGDLRRLWRKEGPGSCSQDTLGSDGEGGKRGSTTPPPPVGAAFKIQSKHDFVAGVCRLYAAALAPLSPPSCLLISSLGDGTKQFVHPNT